MSVKTTACVGATLVALAGAMAGMAQPVHVGPAHGQPAAAQPSTQGSLRFENEILDLGTIHDGAKVEIEFPFKNEGEIPIMIIDAKASCGCTVPEDIKGKVVQPGETASIKGSFNPTGKLGPTSVAIRVETDDPERPKINLSLTATVEPIVKAEPSVVQLGDLTKGEAKTVRIHVSGEMDGFKVLFATASDSGLVDVDVVEHERVDVGDHSRDQSVIEVTFRGTDAVGPISENLLGRTNDERRRLIPVKVLGRVVGDVQIVPDRIGLGLLRPGQPFEKTLKVTSRTGEPFEILGVEPELDIDEPLEVTVVPLESEDGPAYQIKISGTPSADSDERKPVRGRLIVRTNVPGEEEISLNMYGSIRPPTVVQPSTPPK